MLARQVHLFTGKGGVGKSTLVAAFAAALARRGRRPLVVELGHASMGSIFAAEPVGTGPTPVGHGVHAVDVELETALLDYVADVVRVRAVARTILRSKSLERFFLAAPAVAEVAALHTIRRLADAEPRWDPILVDLDATGHAKMFLELPRVFEGLVRGGPLEPILASFTELFRDRARAALHLVTLPAELPVEETVDLHQAFRAGDRVSLGLLLVNRVPPQPLRREEWDALDAYEASLASDDPLRRDVLVARVAWKAWERARSLIETLERAVPLLAVELPELETPPSTIDALVALGERIARAMETAP